jgi:hypothetical protein
MKKAKYKTWKELDILSRVYATLLSIIVGLGLFWLIMVLIRAIGNVY